MRIILAMLVAAALAGCLSDDEPQPVDDPSTPQDESDPNAPQPVSHNLYWKPGRDAQRGGPWLSLGRLARPREAVIA